MKIENTSAPQQSLEQARKQAARKSQKGTTKTDFKEFFLAAIERSNQ